MIGDWKLDLMAKKIFETIWTEKKEAVLEAYKLLHECYQSDANKNSATISAVPTVKFPKSNFKIYAIKQKPKLLHLTKNWPN